ncbi:hypothetical protein [Nocardia huaxiensis]|uniref:Uncharacterized protein n=1 Tax=Nocardia huaxiensis TaxID=2755382 RepID=A0A7D6V7H4_9NOCA|nr:hypothetical protein [Nocardia huaxiensis]QLY29521.1 hypothetical protein H0264_30360 [Nocardia huaxiensis]UFS96921.1 hypothetical protein LPY97_03025 [Nocardia huaxiensis]
MRALALAAGVLLAGTPNLLPRAEAAPPLLITCADSYTEESRLEVSCHNRDSGAGTVDLMYVCSTPLDFGRQIVFNEPGFRVGGGSTLRLTRDCGAEQVVISYQLWPLTAEQQADIDGRQAKIREQRDQATPR